MIASLSCWTACTACTSARWVGLWVLAAVCGARQACLLHAFAALFDVPLMTSLLDLSQGVGCSVLSIWLCAPCPKRHPTPLNSSPCEVSPARVDVCLSRWRGCFSPAGEARCAQRVGPQGCGRGQGGSGGAAGGAAGALRPPVAALRPSPQQHDCRCNARVATTSALWFDPVPVSLFVHSSNTQSHIQNDIQMAHVMVLCFCSALWTKWRPPLPPRPTARRHCRPTFTANWRLCCRRRYTKNSSARCARARNEKHIQRN